MNITFTFDLFRWRIGIFDVRINIDKDDQEGASPLAKPKAMDAVSDYFANRWFARHTA